jgi:hypothetical protein
VRINVLLKPKESLVDHRLENIQQNCYLSQHGTTRGRLTISRFASGDFREAGGKDDQRMTLDNVSKP